MSHDIDLQVATECYSECFGVKPTFSETVTPHASKKRLFRLSHLDSEFKTTQKHSETAQLHSTDSTVNTNNNLSKNSAIVALDDNVYDRNSFVYLTEHFLKFNLRVPEIYGIYKDGAVIVMQDLGSRTLYDFLLDQEFDFSVCKDFYKKVLRSLLDFQITAGTSVNFSNVFSKLSSSVESSQYSLTTVFNRDRMLMDMNYFQKEFIPNFVNKFDRVAVEREFEELADFLSSANVDFFMYRDFQSRNIIIDDDKNVSFIDYQGGMKGPLPYDVVSLLYQARAKIPQDVRDDLLQFYLSLLKERLPSEANEFQKYFGGFLILRMFQVLGLYGKLGVKGGMELFTYSIPLALNNLQKTLVKDLNPVPMPTLSGIVEKIQENHFPKV